MGGHVFVHMKHKIQHLLQWNQNNLKWCHGLQSIPLMRTFKNVYCH